MNLMKIRLLMITALTAVAVSISAANWTDITRSYVQNAEFSEGTAGWTDNLSAQTKGLTNGCMRFFSGSGRFTQQLTGLVKGRYRLRVQGFYRSTAPESAYPAWQSQSEQTAAFLIAGSQQQKLKSLYDFSKDYNAESCWTADGAAYYPDGSSAAAAFFADGLYWNEVEFEGEGDVEIGIVCEQAQYNNWCVFDNFKLEYSGGTGTKTWVDVTSYLVNTGFDGNSKSGWEIVSNADSQTADHGCMEFWNGTFDIWQNLNLPQGHYRLSVQAFYRCKDNFGKEYYVDGEYFYEPGDADNYFNGTQNITGYMYAGETSQKLVSVYSEPRDEAPNGGWARYNWKYYPNAMNSARIYFDEGRYWNTMEFDAGGETSIGLRCRENEWSNWCIFDNFKLEYYTDMVPISGISVSLAQKNLIVGETTSATATIQPATATLPFVSWSTSNNSVVTIDNRGNITAVGEGTATIWCFAADGSGVSGSAIINVEHNVATVGSFVINEIMPSNVDEEISPAFNFDGWVELYNSTNKAVELAGVKVTDPADPTAVWTMPQTMGTVPAKGYRLVWFDSNDGNANNAPFTLDIDGGTITFSTASGQTIASQDYPAALERVSYARSTDATGNWGYCGVPTPSASNNGSQLLTKQIDAPVVDQPSQLFTGSLTVNVAIPSGCTLRYTTDGTLPTQDSQVSYDGHFTIDNTTSFRFRLFGAGKLPSRVSTRSYIYDWDYSVHHLPVISVVTDPSFLYSEEIGVFEKGPNGRPGNGQDDKCNWNMNWERPVNFSYITTDGTMVLNQDVNLEMAGGWSRADWPHSFKLKGSKEMGGDKNLPYPFFDQKPYIRNRTLQIRNGGGDVNGGRFKDPALQYILMSSGVDVDCQSYQPVLEFINGSFMGLLNMREPNNKHYVYANYGWDDDEIDQFEMSPDSGYVQKCGTPDAFNDLVTLSANAANADTYKEICELLDINAYINYMAAELYLCSWDWPQNNVKGFRHRENGRFRFVVFDLDAALSFWRDGKINGTPPFETFFNKGYNYTFDQLRPASLGRITKDIDFVILFRQLLQNDDFRRRFIDAYCLMGGSVYERNRVETVVDMLTSRVNSVWPRTVNTANEIKSGLGSHLNDAIQRMKDFYAFGLSSTEPQNATLGSDTEGARLFVNDQAVPTGQFDGQLFPPVTLRAEAPAGYAFKAWVNEGGQTVSSNATYQMPTGNVALTATFRPLTASEKDEQGITPVRINEVSGANDSYIDEYGKKGDWLELYNTTSEPVDVEGMYLSDNAKNPKKYQITKGNTKANTVIPAHGYLVIWCDNKRETTDNGLHASFKIADDGGFVMLSSADQRWKDVLNYEAHDARTTVGRYPDGSASVYAMNVATIGKSNIMSSYATAVEQTGLPTVPTGLATTATGNLRVAYGSGLLLAKSNEDGEVTIEVFRGDGLQVLQTIATIQGGTARVSVADLSTGFYVARVTDGHGSKASCRFVK